MIAGAGARMIQTKPERFSCPASGPTRIRVCPICKKPKKPANRAMTASTGQRIDDRGRSGDQHGRGGGRGRSR